MDDPKTAPASWSRGRLAGRTVQRIGYGAMQLAERGNRSVLAADDAIAVLRRAVELGVDHIDTAEFYGDGVANDLIRAALHPYPDSLQLVSKVGAARVADGSLVAAQRPRELRAAVDANLRRLGTDRLAVVNLRRMDVRPGLVATGDQIVDIDSQIAELVALRDKGKVGAIGLSNVDADQLRQAIPAGIVCVQNSYNVLERTNESLMDICVAHDIAFVPFFPLGSAFPGARRVGADPVVVDVARSMGVTPEQVGLAWLLARAPQVLLIPGTADVDHLELNMAAGGLALDDAALAALDSAATLGT